MNCGNWGARKYFLFGARIFFGIWLLYVGVAKWVFFGPAEFVNMITGQFDKTWSPHALNVLLGWIIMIAEPIIAIWILSGRRCRDAWMSAAMLMFLLTFGQTMLMQVDVVANNWQYLVLCLGCAALCEPGVCASEKGSCCS